VVVQRWRNGEIGGASLRHSASPDRVGMLVGLVGMVNFGLRAPTPTICFYLHCVTGAVNHELIARLRSGREI